MYVRHQSRWIHPSYCNLAFDFLQRIEHRFSRDTAFYFLHICVQLDAAPFEFASTVVSAYPASQTQLIGSEDVQFFINLCQRGGQKPVPFVPRIDANFYAWFMKDAVWQSEDLNTIIDQDVQRVLVQQGPVAARYSTKVNESVKHILDGIYHGQIAALLEKYYGGDKSKVPTVEYLGVEPVVSTLPSSVITADSPSERVYYLPTDEALLPDHNTWISTICGPRKSWLHALLTAPLIFQGSRVKDNYVRRMMRPRTGQIVTIYEDGSGSVQSLEVTRSSGCKDLDLVISDRGIIVLNIYQPSGTTIHALNLQFAYHPSQPASPIHEVMSGRDDCIRQFYTLLWAGNGKRLLQAPTFSMPGHTIEVKDVLVTSKWVSEYCSVIGTRSVNYQPNSKKATLAPMDMLAIVSVDNLFKSMTSEYVHNGLFNLVHLFNRIQYADGAKLLKVGDTVSCKSGISGLANTDAGKAIVVDILIYREGIQIAVVQSSLLWRGVFIEEDIAYKLVTEPVSQVALKSIEDVKALETREWFVYREGSEGALQPGSVLEFHLKSDYRYSSKDIYSSIKTTGSVLLRSSTHKATHIANVNFECGSSFGNPVTEYLARHGQPAESTAMFEGGGYEIVPKSSSDGMVAAVPDTNWPYSHVSGDYNPIHTNRYVADMAGLPGAITHGLWTSASTRCFIERHAANDQPERVRSYHVNFQGMVFPKDCLETKVFHVGMKDGRILVKGQTFKVDGELVLDSIAEIEQETTAYVFTGQGSQEVGMDMDLYESSPAARAVWDRAEQHMLKVYGVSLLKVVRTNPTQLTVFFGGKLGAQIRSNYMALSKHRDSKAARLFPGITEATGSFTFKSPSGLLNATQFTQPALVVLELAAVADLRSRSLVQKSAAFAGHSLGEYSALAAIGEVFSVEDAVDIAFYRGMVMQSAIDRDEQNRSQFGMVAVDPSRVGSGFDENALALVVETIRTQAQGLLEIVNYNVKGSQYVVAGSLVLLAAMGSVIDRVAEQRVDVTGEVGRGAIGDIAAEALASTGGAPLKRGRATVPLAGIDVPFHSTQLAPGVEPFREYLLSKIDPSSVDYSTLHNRYIPNLTGLPFEVSRDYFKLVHDLTESPVIGKHLQNASGGGGSAGGAVINSAEFDKAQREQREHVLQQMQMLARYAGIDLREGARSSESTSAEKQILQSELDRIGAEFGAALVEGTKSLFDPRKARRYDSSWNWARQEAVEWVYGILAGRDQPSHDQASDSARLHALANRSTPALLNLVAATILDMEKSSGELSRQAVAVAKRIYAACKEALNSAPVYKEMSAPTCPNTRVTSKGDIEYSETPRENEPSFVEYVQHMKLPAFGDKPPFLHLRSLLEENRRSYNEQLSQLYFNALEQMSTTGLSFAGKTALVTGCGRGSIGADILRGLLAGGARVVATTSSYSRRTTLFYEEMYREHGARGSELIVVPFNQGSTVDITALVEYIYSDARDSKGLGWDLDFVIPFAAIPEMGSNISGINSHSELAHRVMLTNVLRLLGEIKEAKDRLGYVTHPSLAVLPLSPNHGDLGGDGLYGESKAGLEVIFNCWESESWAEYLSIAGAAIGWTRGTRLMSSNNILSYELETIGVRTFSTREMAFNILGLLHPDISKLAETEPVWADFSGGIRWLPNIGSTINGIRSSLNTASRIMKETIIEFANEYGALTGGREHLLYVEPTYDPLANHKYRFPAIKSYEQLKHLHHLQGMVNLDKVVVVTGYGEVGPFGNAEHRWEMEAFGEFSLEGCIELAWIMGLIKHHSGPLKSTGAIYTGWVDAKSGEPVKDKHIKARYEAHILEHTGIRLIEPEMMDGYDPNKKLFMRELQIEHDMEPFEATADEAAAFRHQNGDRVDVWENKDGSWSVRFLKGAFILVPKALRFDRLVAAQIPTGWDPARYGIPNDIVKQVDLVTCYALVATVEALVRSGIADPYELYRYFHVSEIGNSMGSGMGGANKLHHAFRKRFLDGELQSDIFQETFISTTAAWVNMLLLSSSGPIKPTVGACATSVLSVEVAVETIQSGKAKMMLAGGFETFTEESTYEFAQMGATSNSLEEFASGRTPKEMCRPCTSTRNGFMEAEGAGVVTLMSASAAIEFGAPIYGIVAMSGTATDKQGNSVPAPGQGVLTSARETAAGASPRLLDINYRRRQLDRQLAAIDEWVSDELEELNSDAELAAKEAIATEAERQRSVARDAWGNDFWRGNPQISPLRGSLAVWGLTVDDIGVASFHGTSTVANDKNESEVLNRQMAHLGRTPGLAVPALAHRVMLTNVIRLLGEIKDAKVHLGYVTHPSLVVLPLSPNHGDLGGDGLYGESKAGLEVILNCWESESWADYLSIAGAAIGWTRGTRLMSSNNILSYELETIGVRTFSTREMAFNTLGLLHPDISKLAEMEPVWADFSGGIRWLPNIGSTINGIRSSLNTASRIIKETIIEFANEYGALTGGREHLMYVEPTYDPLANHKYPFPATKSYEQLKHLHHLQGMVNLDKVVVVTGYGEVGPFGNAEHRWEMEAFGEFSLEGCIELAWIMGLIKHHNGPHKSTGTVYNGWVDAESGDPVKDRDIKAKYESYILEHTGIRLIESGMMNDYDPNKKPFIRELQIEHDMEPFEATADEAAAFKHQNDDRVDVWENKNGSWSVRFLKGAVIHVPKALRFDRLVSVQPPTGWDPARYGIPDDIVKQVDLVTCYALVATVEALVRSGITDPYELYRYFHVSEIGNSIGSSIGGGRKVQGVFKNRFLEKEIQSDVLQETFINTTAAWINMLLMSSSGPIKPMVGACGTSVLSIETAVETIQTGKAKVMLAGGFEAFTEESSYEFAQMGATSNSVDEFASGRTPGEMCRPCTSTRNGFIEGEGAGVVTLMSASAAIEFGAPIYGIVAMSGTATDKQGSSVPAPGKGVLTSAREAASAVPPRLLDMGYRRRQLDRQLADIDEWKRTELESLTGNTGSPNDSIALSSEQIKGIQQEYELQRCMAVDTWGHEFWKKDDRISPLRGSLAVWGLGVDDIGVASFHGTSTVANDKNESEVLNCQMEHLGRTPGLAVPAVCQKWLTGHPKGPAAAWMLDGVLQTLRTGIIPGNRNADNIDQEFEKLEYIVYPSRSIQTAGIKAGLVKSFGFGQVGGELLVVHPDYLLAALTREQLDEYTEKVRQREAKSYRYWQDTLVGNHPFVQMKEAPPYTLKQEKQVYLDPLARAKYDSVAKQYKF
ncbi:hypothetical protein GQ54DRAFT_336614 [Martensiomyces pterosporus]|nr:hypothetical protein GQ54DRAFT_336614 [Martensiomyces pterosporus]